MKDKRTRTLLENDPDFFSRISQMRKNKRGGKGFSDPETQRKAQEIRKQNKRKS